MSSRSLLVLAAAALAAGCASAAPATAGQLRARAAFELSCSPEQLALVRIDPTTGGVIGCGRRAVYVERCSDRGCSWAFDREVPLPGAPAYAPTRSYANVHALPHVPRLAEDPDQWRRRIPGLVDDQPGF
jgi:hypothetical protein